MTIVTEPPKTALRQAGSPFEVLWAFLKLGLTSFGGPIAHLGYFREEFVVRRRWLDTIKPLPISSAYASSFPVRRVVSSAFPSA